MNKKLIWNTRHEYRKNFLLINLENLGRWIQIAGLEIVLDGIAESIKK